MVEIKPRLLTVADLTEEYWRPVIPAGEGS